MDPKTNQGHLIIPIGTKKGSKKRNQNRVKTTKYSLLTFIPLNLYDQFRRAVYFYFLIVTIISFFVNSTISPLVSLLPLLFVIIVTGIKEGREDYLRYKNDRLVNSQPVKLFENAHTRTIQAENIAIGSLIEVEQDCEVPCDLVLLHSSNPSGKCFITTANLDGETNLKTLQVPATPPPSASRDELEDLGIIECEPPQADLYSFKGKLLLKQNDSHVVPLSIENLVLRGARLRNTSSIIGCAVYTGMQTKLQMNSRFTGNKVASSEIYINKFLIFLVVGMIAGVTLLYFLGRTAELDLVPFISYLGPSVNVNSFSQIADDYLSFLILFNYMIPISMYMNIELYRVFGAFFIESDLEMYDPVNDQPALVNASNLNEDLGQIQILFSDKTGTLTKNEMIFKQCSIGGRKFRIQENQITEAASGDSKNYTELEHNEAEFLQALALCHTVQILPTGKDVEHPEYQAASADELALLEACASLGLVYANDEDNFMTLKFPKDSHMESKAWKRLQVLEFSSERKRMSIVLEDDMGFKWLYAKGAESSILPLCRRTSEDLITITDEHISEFARQGLRTLAIARRSLTEPEYQHFQNQLMQAKSSIENQEQMIQEAYSLMEQDLQLMGATAVEDALQDQVKDTLLALQEAGMRIWVLTGDKVETAFNIGLSCGHIPTHSHNHFIVNCSTRENLSEAFGNLSQNLESQTSSSYSLIIDGVSLAVALIEFPETFQDLALQCTAVLCCRLSPLQKSEVVSLIKKSKQNLITAAVGDGANDVSMLQEAHVGIGIFGKEGRQAARSADFAVSQFSMLQRLFLIHGHYNTARLAFLVLFYCYKNMIHTTCMFLYQLYNLYSSAAVFHGLYMWLFDIVYLSFSFTFVAMSEKPYPEHVLLKQPGLYRKIVGNSLYKWKRFLLWLLNGVYHGLIIFYFAYLLFTPSSSILYEGQTGDLYVFGSILIQTLISVGNLKLLLISNYISLILLLMICLSFMGFIFTTVLYNIILINGINSLYNVYNYLFLSPVFWLYSLVTIVACLIPDLFLKTVQVTRKNPKSLKNHI